MSGAKLDLAALQALITLGGYGGRGNCAPSTSVLGLSAALFLSDLSIWQGAGDTLSDAEIDDIQELIAQLESDLMITDYMYPEYRCKVINDTDQTIPTDTTVSVFFNTEIYDPLNMHSLISNTDRIYILSDGLYIISANVNWQYSSVGYRSTVLFKHRPSVPETIALGYSVARDVTGTMIVTSNITTQDECLAGDLFFLRVYQTSGGDVDLWAHDKLPAFSVVRI